MKLLFVLVNFDARRKTFVVAAYHFLLNIIVNRPGIILVFDHSFVVIFEPTSLRLLLRVAISGLLPALFRSGV